MWKHTESSPFRLLIHYCVCVWRLIQREKISYILTHTYTTIRIWNVLATHLVFLPACLRVSSMEGLQMDLKWLFCVKLKLYWLSFTKIDLNKNWVSHSNFWKLVLSYYTIFRYNKLEKTIFILFIFIFSFMNNAQGGRSASQSSFLWKVSWEKKSNYDYHGVYSFLFIPFNIKNDMCSFL